MEYVFGSAVRRGVLQEALKTKGDVHSNLEGIVETKREYDDSVIIDRFKVIEKFRSKEDEEGNCYDWYTIDNHYRYVDFFTPQKESIIKSATPYTITATAYIDDTSITFNDVPNGNLSLFMIDGDNQPVPCTYERINSDVKVSFEQRTSLATVTIQIS